MNPVKVVKGFKDFFSNISKLIPLFSEFMKYFLYGSKQLAGHLHLVQGWRKRATLTYSSC